MRSPCAHCCSSSNAKRARRWLRRATTGSRRASRCSVYCRRLRSTHTDGACGSSPTTPSLPRLRVDAGATSIFSGNRYLTEFITRFGLARADPEPNATLGIWDGAAFRVRWPEDSTIPVRMLARYGPVVRAAIAKLNKIYDLQAANRTYASPEALLDALGLLPLTQAPRLTPTYT